MHHGATVWFTGLPSAGKTTIATYLSKLLRGQGTRTELLDGDAVRPHLSAGLGYSREDRDTNVGRIGWVAQTLARNGVIALAATVSPYAQARDAVGAMHAAQGIPFLEVHVATPLAECAARDVKGLYAQAAAGRLSGLTGVDDPYEPPSTPALTLDTTTHDVATCATRVLILLSAHGVVPPVVYRCPT
jgi:adenylylsulfate kinase